MRMFRALTAGLLVTLAVAGCVPAAAPPTVAPAATKPAATTPPPAASPASSPVAAPATAAAASPVASPVAKPTIKVASNSFPESVVLAEVYAQTLEANGYRVDRRFNLGNREVVFPAFESGQIDLYPEYVASLLAFVAKITDAKDPAVASTQLKAALQPKGLDVLDYAPAVDTNAYVVTKATADRLKLAKMSDLTAQTGKLTLGGPAECPERPFCILGIKSVYGTEFKEFKALDAGGPLTVAALEANQVDVGMLFSTDSAIVQKGFVLLEDDKKLQSADNVAPVVRNAILSTVPADFRTSLNAVSAKLTTAKLTDLNKQVGVDRKEPKDVAAAFLKAEGIVR